VVVAFGRLLVDPRGTDPMQKQFEARLYERGSAESRLIAVDVDVDRLIIDGNRIIALNDLDIEITGHEDDRLKIHDRLSGATIICSERSAELLEEIHRADGNGHLKQKTSATQMKVKAMPWLKATYWLRIAFALMLVVIIGHFVVDKLIDAAADRIDPSMETKFGGLFFKTNKYDRTSANFKRIEKIGTTLASKIKDCPYKFNFYLDKTPEVNACAYPGGFVVVNQGLMDKATSDDEIAGVLGHELGHVIHRDGVHKMMHGLGLVCCVGVLAGMGGDYSGQVAQALSVGKFLEEQSYSRDKEARCDIFGVDLTARAGYEADGIAKFFEKMQAAGGSGDNKVLEMFLTHPLDSTRIATIKAECQRLRKEHPEWFVKHTASRVPSVTPKNHNKKH
jgi:Zn-dependent protease with chaperone function